MNDEHLRDRTCTFCKGEGGYWEQGPNASTQCSQCNTNWNRIRGFKHKCKCDDCTKGEAEYLDQYDDYVLGSGYYT